MSCADVAVEDGLDQNPSEAEGLGCVSKRRDEKGRGLTGRSLPVRLGRKPQRRKGAGRHADPV